MARDTMTPIYNHEGLSAFVIDNEGISMYLENNHCLTMTLQEWRNINIALEALEE